MSSWAGPAKACSSAISFGLGESLKFIALDGSQDPVLRDFAGRLLNYRNPEVLEVLRFLPDAVGNTVRKALLQIYMDMDSYRLEEAERHIFSDT